MLDWLKVIPKAHVHSENQLCTRLGIQMRMHTSF